MEATSCDGIPVEENEEMDGKVEEAVTEVEDVVDGGIDIEEDIIWFMKKFCVFESG